VALRRGIIMHYECEDNTQQAQQGVISENSLKTGKRFTYLACMDRLKLLYFMLFLYGFVTG
jgi:hypothetical protein